MGAEPEENHWLAFGPAAAAKKTSASSDADETIFAPKSEAQDSLQRFRGVTEIASRQYYGRGDEDEEEDARGGDARSFGHAVCPSWRMLRVMLFGCSG
ncbi:hypothetical protein BD410DRAFT_902598 [Rickenella mellea]|uniref:Uncharacterized protein n=1 Tax=Rickenella mellea TaxID=50990 RepID=A0A4Y7PK32_9AGAM|nr:hypothetical protein BD410DRAFT_902598 [Rickenella mellea]